MQSVTFAEYKIHMDALFAEQAVELRRVYMEMERLKKELEDLKISKTQDS